MVSTATAMQTAKATYIRFVAWMPNFQRRYSGLRFTNSPFVWRVDKGFFKTPAHNIYSVFNGLSAYWGPYTPLCKSLGNPGDCEVSVVRSVSLLGCWRCPPAVSWLVSFIRVNPINRVFGSWFRSHVGQKQGVIVPSAANLNPSPAIRKILGVVRVIASSLHVLPSYVLGCFPSRSTGVPVLNLQGTLLAGSVDGKTSARARRSFLLSERANPNFCFSSTITQTAPVDLGLPLFSKALRGLFNDKKPSKALTNRVNFGGHDPILIIGLCKGRGVASNCARPANNNRLPCGTQNIREAA